MTQRDGQDMARLNEQRILKALHKYGWLRTRDIAALLWMRGRPKRPGEFLPELIELTASALRMAQRSVARLRTQHSVISAKGPDGSVLYALSEAGARALLAQGIPARSGKDQLRRVSLSYYHHRRLANELAIVATLQGYRVATEYEIAKGQWFGGKAGILGKIPDVLVRDGKNVGWVEVERSRRNRPDYDKLLTWLMTIRKSHTTGATALAPLPGDMQLSRVLFACNRAFVDKLRDDLARRGWPVADQRNYLAEIPLLYVSEAKFIVKSGIDRGAAEHSDGEMDSMG